MMKDNKKRRLQVDTADKGRRLKIVLSILAFIVLLVFIKAYKDTRIDIVHYEVEDIRIPDSFKDYKILQVSDLYLDEDYDSQEIIAKLNKNLGDMIVFTGNIFENSSKKTVDKLLEIKKGLDKDVLTYISIGQTELKLGQDFIEKTYPYLEKEGIFLLTGKKIPILKGASTINIYGIRPDLSHYDLEDGAFVNIDPGLDIDKSEFNIVFSHNPQYVYSIKDQEAQVMVSGNNNGGWIRLPILGGLDYESQSQLKDRERWIYNTHLFISRGSGSREGKFRLFNPPEILEISLRGKYE